ncbi:MAG: hypothetical protein R6T99_03195 [Bacteroidales bacterium]
MNKSDALKDPVFKKDYTRDSKKARELIHSINKWSNKAGIGDVKDLGKKIDITRITFYRVFELRIKSQEEKRSLTASLRPYKGEKIGQRTVNSPEEVNPWNLDLRKPDDFADGRQNYEIAGSHYIKECGLCHGAGEINCRSCMGRGKTICPACNGKKSITCTACGGSPRQRCTACNGSGRITVKYNVRDNSASGFHTRTETRSCGCSGGVVICGACNGTGRMTCKTCGGTGKIQCKTCRGKGRVTCELCDGHKKVLSYVNLKQEFILNSKSLLYNIVEMARLFPGFKETVQKAPADVLVKERATELPKGKFRDHQSFDRYYDNLVDKIKEDAKGEKVHFQEVSLTEIPVYQVDYKYKKKAYALLVYGRDTQVYSPVSPVSELFRVFYDRAGKREGQNRVSSAINAYELARSLDVENEYSAEIKQALDRLYMKSEKVIRTGVMFGVLSAIYFLSLLSIAYFSPHNFWIPFFDTYAENHPALLKVNHFTIPFTLLILGRPVYKYISGFLSGRAKRVYNLNIVRILYGAAGGAAGLLLVFALLALLNKFGILFMLDHIYRYFYSFLGGVVEFMAAFNS